MPSTRPPSIESEPSAFQFAMNFDEPSAVAVWVLGALGWILLMRRVFRGYNVNG